MMLSTFILDQYAQHTAAPAEHPLQPTAYGAQDRCEFSHLVQRALAAAELFRWARQTIAKLPGL
jgi:hypothetical protein